MFFLTEISRLWATTATTWSTPRPLWRSKATRWRCWSTTAMPVSLPFASMGRSRETQWEPIWIQKASRGLALALFLCFCHIEGLKRRMDIPHVLTNTSWNSGSICLGFQFTSACFLIVPLESGRDSLQFRHDTLPWLFFFGLLSHRKTMVTHENDHNDLRMLGFPHLNRCLQDLDFYDLGGDLTWLPPNDTERLNAYLVYLAEGADRWLIFFRLSSGTGARSSTKFIFRFMEPSISPISHMFDGENDHFFRDWTRSWPQVPPVWADRNWARRCHRRRSAKGGPWTFIVPLKRLKGVPQKWQIWRVSYGDKPWTIGMIWKYPGDYGDELPPINGFFFPNSWMVYNG